MHSTEEELWEEMKADPAMCPCPKKRNRIKVCKAVGNINCSGRCESVIDRENNGGENSETEG